MFYHNEIVILYTKSSVKKFVFFDSSTKLSEFVEDIACHAFAPDCSIQVLPKFHEVLSTVFVCM